MSEQSSSTLRWPKGLLLAASARADASPADASALASGDCFDAHRFVTPVEPTIENLSASSPSVVVGTFRGYGPSFWDTPDGSRPQRADVDSGASEILTPVAIDVSEVAKGDGDAADEAVVWGGTVGCDRFSSEGDLTLEAGERSFFSLLPQTKEGKATGHVWVVTSWLIGPDDEVATPLEGTRSMDQLIREIPAGKAKPAPPVGSGKPPESSP